MLASRCCGTSQTSRSASTAERSVTSPLGTSTSTSVMMRRGGAGGPRQPTPSPAENLSGIDLDTLTVGAGLPGDHTRTPPAALQPTCTARGTANRTVCTPAALPDLVPSSIAMRTAFLAPAAACTHSQRADAAVREYGVPVISAGRVARRKRQRRARGGSGGEPNRIRFPSGST